MSPTGNGRPPWEGEDKGHEARIVAEMAAAHEAARAAAEEEAIRARIMKKQQRRKTRTLAQEQNRTVPVMAGLPPKEKENSNGEDSSDDADPT